MRTALVLFVAFFFSLYGSAQSLYKFKKGSKEGFINGTGNVVVSPIYDDVDDFSENYAKVKIGSKYGYINSNGEEVIAIKYLRGTAFKEGLAAVKDESGWHYIDKKGEVKYDEKCNCDCVSRPQLHPGCHGGSDTKVRGERRGGGA